LSGVCRDGVCDETAGGCVARNHTAGTACDDGNPCTVSDVCTDAAACAGSPRDCGDADRCTVDSCNGTTGACEHVPTPIPGAEGPAGNATCGDGIDNDCDGRTDAADPDCGGCAGHADCDDADPCTTDTCVGGACAHAPAATGTLCNDGLWCTVGDACAAGTCAGTPRDCSAAAGVCTAGACDEDTDACRARPVADGTACDDGDPLTLRDVCVSGRCVASTCGDGYLDTGGGEFCDDGNILTETCRLPPAGSCIRDCSIQQPTCGNATTETALGESCDDGNADSFDACTTSCTVNDFGVGAPCTCTGSGCTLSNPTAGTINGCSGVVVPTGARLACFRSGSLLGNNMYFPNGFCSAYASTCSGFLCGMLGGGGNIGTYASFTTCPPGSVLLLQTISQTGITLRTKTCQKVCTRDSQCRWNEYDPAWSSCGQYECMSAPALPGTNVCFDGRSSAP
jgi:cysteine-rich repeat protein